MRNFHKLNIDTRGQGSGRIKTFCPFCRETRTNKRDRSLSVDIDKGLYLCHYCGAKGYVPDEAEERERELRRLRREQKTAQQTAAKRYVRPTWHPEEMQLPEEIAEYLTKERKISLETAGRLKISARPHPNLPQGEGVNSGATPSSPLPWAIASRHSNRGASATEGRQGGGSSSSLCFNYFLHGELINVKTRTLDKKFTLVRGAELIPYNIDSIEGEPVCYITEGEFDTLTLVECGFPQTVSVPSGGLKPHIHWENFNIRWVSEQGESQMVEEEERLQRAREKGK